MISCNIQEITNYKKGYNNEKKFTRYNKRV